MHKFTHIPTYVFLIKRHVFYCVLFMSVFCLCLCILFCVFCLFIVSLFLCVLLLPLCCLFPILVQVCRQLPPGRNQITLNKYHVMSNTHTYILYLRMYVYVIFIIHYIRMYVVHTHIYIPFLYIT
jgi:hypothetical protein